MAVQLSDAARNAAADAVEDEIGQSPVLEIRTGNPPANCAAADSGTLLVSMTLPADWLGNASAGSKSLQGVWEDQDAGGAGEAGHFRIKASGACHIQGTVTITGGGGDMTLDNPNIAVGQKVTITNFTLTAGGA